MRRPLLVALLALSCHPTVRWARPTASVPAVHAQVRTVNPGYRRNGSQVLVREVDVPTRANLDWAAYHANFMNADPPPEEAPPTGTPDTAHPFAGTLDPGTLTSSITTTPLTADERAHPLAFAPLVEYLAARKAAGGLEEVGAAIRGETWGLGAAAGIARQLASEVYVHESEGQPSLWVKVEIAPWFKALGALPDEDGDGVPELYGRIRADLVSAASVKVLQDDYAGRVLSPAEVKTWANQLSSYWYPSYNTDLVHPRGDWPEADTEEPIRRELGDAKWPAPAIVMRGKPQGKPLYNVFLIKGATASQAAPAAALVLQPTAPSAQPRPIVDLTRQELAEHGGTWPRWSERLAPFQTIVRAKLGAAPSTVKGVTGSDGFLYYRNELESVIGGDLTTQPKGKDPLPVIADFRKALASRGIDFLFVPVPNKVEVLPERLDRGNGKLVGQVVNPYARKFLQDLAGAGVEPIDLLPAFLAERAHDASAAEPLYQAQDTHWTDRGLQRAAHLVAERIKKYPWYAELSRHRRRYVTREATFTRHGDLVSRLAPAAQRRYQPQTLVAHQVLEPGGAAYEDDAESPIVVLGDSFTGVYELTDCEHAGVSAHIAREIGYPVDLVMSYGGGPNVRQKLLRRGVDALAKKRLVVWMMTARDLHAYWEDWKPLDLAAK
jgi:hypothetical protein